MLGTYAHQKRASDSLKLELQINCELMCGCWELNLGLLLKQVLLAAEPSLHACVFHLCETLPCYVAHGGLKFVMVLLPQPLKYSAVGRFRVQQSSVQFICKFSLRILRMPCKPWSLPACWFSQCPVLSGQHTFCLPSSLIFTICSGC